MKLFEEPFAFAEMMEFENEELRDAAKMSQFENWRERELTRTDFTQMPDADISDEERLAWKEYRQALRDLPQQYKRVDDFVFPERPSSVSKDR